MQFSVHLKMIFENWEDMKKRQSIKIIKRIISFKQWNSNYQPYSIPQQRIAFSHVGCHLSEISNCLFYKIPVKYRFLDPKRIAGAMVVYQMQPTTAKEYDLCMQKLELIAHKKSCPSKGTAPRSTSLIRIALCLYCLVILISDANICIYINICKI